MGGCASKCCCLCCIGHYDEYTIYKNPETDVVPSIWPCAATGLYTPIPAYGEEALRADARYLHQAMKGIGTRDSDMGRLLASRTPKQIARIKRIFDNEFGDDETLEQWIKDDTSGDWEKSLIMTVMPRAETDAQLLRDTMEGLGTADDELREIMCTRSNKQMMKIQDAYKRKFDHTLAADIKDDTSFNYKKTLVALQSRAEYLAIQLNDAIKGAGTDDIRLIRILCSANRSWGLMRRLVAEFDDHFKEGFIDEVEYEISMPDLQDIKAAYNRLFHKSLVQDVANDTTGNYRRTLLTLLQPPEETTADALNLALEGKGTDDDVLIEVMIGRSNRELQEAAQVYQRKYGRPLADAIKSDTSGDYRQTLMCLLRPRHEMFAWSLHDAMEGLGTDDMRLMSLIIGKSRYELRRSAIAYEKEHGKPLEEAVRSETSFWYKRYLVYHIRQALENLIWVPDATLKRIRDI